MNLRLRRMNAEWDLLQLLSTANPRVLTRIARGEDDFRVELEESPAWMGAEEQRWIERKHTVRFAFPRYYPALPLEGYLERPVLHPNVDARNGFVCLWRSYRSACTIVDAVAILRTMLCWEAVNETLEHKMQDVRGLDVLRKMDLTVPAECRPLTRARDGRQRLEAAGVDYAI
jgi:ubiquitin-protein ligase